MFSCRESKLRKNVQIRVRATNQHVVAYSPLLLYIFDCHIDVEVGTAVKMWKHLIESSSNVSGKVIIYVKSDFTQVLDDDVYRNSE